MDDRPIDTQTPPGKVQASVVGDILVRVRFGFSDRYERLRDEQSRERQQ